MDSNDLDEVKNLTVVDYVVFAAMLLISAGIGVYFRFSGDKQKQESAQEFMLAGRNMSIMPVAFSLMATFKSAVAYIGYPSEVYVYGTAILWNQIWHVFGTVFAAYFFIPTFFDLQCTTAYEYLKRRFGPVMRIVGSLTFIGQMMLYMSVVLYAPALALSAVTTMPLWISIVSIGFVCTLYCTMGGMKAVLWTDAFQAVIMYIGLLLLIIKGCIDLGGVNNVVQVANEGGRFVIPSYEFSFTERYNFWNVIIQGFFLAAANYGCSQIQIQRILTVKNAKRAQKALFLSTVMSVSFMCLLAGLGIVMYVYFKDCDPLSSPQKFIQKNDQLLPFYAMILLHAYPGLPGLCISSVFSAALSTVSSAVSALTTVTIEDFITPFCRNRKTPFLKSVMFVKIVTVAYGVLSMVGTLVVAKFGGVLQASLTIFGIFQGPIMGTFFLGMFTTTANEMGAVIGIISSVVVVAWSSFGNAAPGIKEPPLPLSIIGCPTNSSITNTVSIVDFLNFTATYVASSTDISLPDDSTKYIFPLYKVSFMWIAGIGFFLSLVIGYIVSIAVNLYTGTRPVFDQLCLNPMIRKLLLPRTCKENMKHEDEQQNPHKLESLQDPINGVVNVTFNESLRTLSDEKITKF